MTFAVELSGSRSVDRPVGDPGRRADDDLRPGRREAVFPPPLDTAMLTRAELRDCLSVQNERLSFVLESLERAGQLGRTPADWQ